jgi:hypothetical protein
MDDHAAKQTQATQVHDDNMGSESDEEQQPKAKPWGRLFSISAEHQSIGRVAMSHFPSRLFFISQLLVFSV